MGKISTLTIRFSFIIALWTMVACGGNSVVTPLNYTLETYTEQDASGEWRLRGVRESQTGTVIIKPDSYEQINCDDNFIICTKKDGLMAQIWVYYYNGEMVGWFDTFNHIVSPTFQSSPLSSDEPQQNQSLNASTSDYYIGTNYNIKSYFFPKTEVLINTRYAFEGTSHLLLYNTDVWQVITMDGNMQIRLPTDSKVVHNLTSDPKEEFFLVNESTNKVSLFDIDSGQEVKEYSVKEWQQLESNAFTVKQLEHLMILETKNFSFQ